MRQAVPVAGVTGQPVGAACRPQAKVAGTCNQADRLPRAQRPARAEALFQQLGEEDYLLTVYETKNSAEFFAVAYVDYLDRRWELPTTRELDPDGLLGEVFAFFYELGPHPRG
jgi:hypothetical protein